MCRRRAVSLLAAVLASAPCALRAESASDAEALPVVLEFSGCAALDQRESLKLLAIEFQTLNVEPRAPLERVRITCGPSVARITIDERPTSNEVQLAATSASAWPRLLALSVSELVIESRAQVVTPRAPSSVPTPRTTPPSAKGNRETTPERRRFRLFAGVLGERALRSATWLGGPELGFELDWTPHVSLLADARVEFGGTRTDVAAVRWLATRAALGVLIGGRAGVWQAGLGPGVSFGYLRLSPTVSQLSATGHVVSGAWGGPLLTARGELDFSERAFARLSVDSGIVVLPVTGQVDGERRLVDAGGAWISSGLQLGVLF